MRQKCKTFLLKFPLVFISDLVSIIPEIKKALPFDWAAIISNKSIGEGCLLVVSERLVSWKKLDSIFSSFLTPLGISYKLEGVPSSIESLYYLLRGGGWDVKGLEVFGSLQKKRDVVSLVNNSRLVNSRLYFFILRVLGAYGLQKLPFINTIKGYGYPLPLVKYVFGGTPISYPSDSSFLFGIHFGMPEKGGLYFGDGDIYYINMGVKRDSVCREAFGEIMSLYKCDSWDIHSVASYKEFVGEIYNSCEIGSLFHSSGYHQIPNVFVDSGFPYIKYLKDLKASGKTQNKVL